MRKPAGYQPTGNQQQGRKHYTMPQTQTMLARLLAKTRTTDPDTSHRAAANITPAEEVSVRDAILVILRAYGPLTHDEIHAYYQADGGTRTPQRVRTATHELRLAGLVQKSNVIGLGRTNNGGDSQRWEVSA